MATVAKRSLNGFGEGTFKRRKSLVIPKSTNPKNDEGISECFHKFSTALYVSLAPCHLNNPINGIKAQHLDPMVMTYFGKAQGVILSYSNIQLSGDNRGFDVEDNEITIAQIEGSSPFTFMWITVDFLVWKPQLGDVLEGYIYMQTASHLGLLIHDTFNASIKKYNIPNDWSFIPIQEDEIESSEEDGGKFKTFGYWQNEHGIKVEGKLRFTIKSIHSTGKVVSVEGTLIEPGEERESQPVARERRSSIATTNQNAPNSHTKFDDEQEEIAVSKVDDDIPGYTKDNEDEDVINESSEDEEDEEDSD
ncbi:uncharacterized protein KQ657_000631 [Scheffersomyces spartinae]|uniref:DNA-directed RNA polymerase subunit n=1 Tax=Scheffersomyces spartinae TaxID=45513 RepID=A0A9P7V989_9ASCO|nr:uncharacterized protein KQ657_000631 [Scheffersomyces spartinae]KAG7193562.1 hypothetical protein KQ657_000631 [Scheffersomyces spartinae]